MKTIHNINIVSFILTLLLYLTVIGGLLAQIALGFIQVILAIAVLLLWESFNSDSKKLISIYWISVVSYGLISLRIGNQFKDLWIAFYIIVPMSIAAYFVYVTYSIKNQSELD